MYSCNKVGFEGKHFDYDRPTQYMILRKELCGGYRPEELPKIENNAGQTDLEKQKQYWGSRKANQNRILRNFREHQGYLKKN